MRSLIAIAVRPHDREARARAPDRARGLTSIEFLATAAPRHRARARVSYALVLAIIAIAGNVAQRSQSIARMSLLNATLVAVGRWPRERSTETSRKASRRVATYVVATCLYMYVQA
jgi:hypothetical protein